MSYPQQHSGDLSDPDSPSKIPNPTHAQISTQDLTDQKLSHVPISSQNVSDPHTLPQESLSKPSIQEVPYLQVCLRGGSMLNLEGSNKSAVAEYDLFKMANIDEARAHGVSNIQIAQRIRKLDNSYILSPQTQRCPCCTLPLV
jgi:hypothetical protein